MGANWVLRPGTGPNLVSTFAKIGGGCFHLWTYFNDFFGGVGCVTSTSWLEFDGDPDQDHDADTGIFKVIFAIVGWGNSTNFTGNSRSYQRILINILRGLDFDFQSINQSINQSIYLLDVVSRTARLKLELTAAVDNAITNITIRIQDILTDFLSLRDIRPNIRILRDQLPWRRFVVSECF